MGGMIERQLLVKIAESKILGGNKIKQGQLLALLFMIAHLLRLLDDGDRVNSTDKGSVIQITIECRG